MIRRGYTLIELAMSMAIAGIVAAAAIGTFAVINRSVVQLRTEAAVETKLQRVLANLVADAQEIGGGPIRPWHAVYAQPGTLASLDSDALLMLTADPDSDPCTVGTYDEVLGEIVFPREDRDGDPATGPGGKEYCCLYSATPVDFGENSEPDYEGRFAVVTKDDDSTVVGVTRVGPAPACSVVAEPFLKPVRSAGFADFSGGTLSTVDAKWIAVDHALHALKAYILTCYEHIPDALEGPVPPATLGISVVESETRTLARDVYDFQIAMGYDGDLDGQVEEAVGGVGDEWVGNLTGETAGESWINDDLLEGPGDVYARGRFRMIEFGLIVGLTAKNDAKRSGTTVLDSGTVGAPNRYQRAGKARAMFRNSGIYE